MVPLYSAAVVVGCVVRHRFWDLQVGLPWDRHSKEGSLLGASLLPRGVGFDAFSTLGHGIFGFSPIFTHFHPFSHLFAHLHHIHSFLGGSVSMGMMRYFHANICSASFS